MNEKGAEPKNNEDKMDCKEKDYYNNITAKTVSVDVKCLLS